MSSRCVLAVLILMASRLATSAPQPRPPFIYTGSAQRALLNRYCVSCHSDKLHTAGLSLETADVAKISGNAALWEKVLEKVRSGSMPPAGLPRPDAAAYSSLAAYLETSLDRAAAAKPQPGRVPVHRLNRAEYTNAIRDLLGLDVDVESLLPVDDSGYGFDNIADVLSVSPVLLERYLSAARVRLVGLRWAIQMSART